MKNVVIILLAAYAASVHADTGAGMTAYAKGDYETARKELSAAAEEKGSAPASVLFLLAQLFHYGRGGEQDMVRAIRYYTASAEKGFGMSKVELGGIYSSGLDGVKIDIEKAIGNYEDALNQKQPSKGASTSTHLLIPQFAARGLGRIYYDGKGRVEKDTNKAVEHFKFAAERGDLYSANMCGVIYSSGTGVEKDDVEAYGWYSFAAKAGNGAARSNLKPLSARLCGDELLRAEERAREIGAAINAFREQAGADQPDIASESKPEGDEKPQSESEGRSR